MGACRAMVYVVAGLAVAGRAQRRAVGRGGGAARVRRRPHAGGQGRGRRDRRALAGGRRARARPSTGPRSCRTSAVALLLVAFLLWAGYALWLVLAQHRIGAGVVRLIAGIAIYDALVVAGAGGSAVAAGASASAAFLLTIALQTKIAGT